LGSLEAASLELMSEPTSFPTWITDYAESGRSSSNGVDINTGRSATYDFLLLIHSNH